MTTPRSPRALDVAIVVGNRLSAADEAVQRARRLDLAAAATELLFTLNDRSLFDMLEGFSGQKILPEDLVRAGVVAGEQAERETAIAASLVHGAEQVREFGLPS